VTASQQGMIIGAVLALTGVAFNFGALVLVAIAIAIGWAVGRVADGKLDLRGVTDALRGRRSS
jgi:hypothetical protein